MHSRKTLLAQTTRKKKKAPHVHPQRRIEENGIVFSKIRNQNIIHLRTVRVL